MIQKNNLDPTGLIIESYEVRGQEWTNSTDLHNDRDWVGADVVLNVPPAGRFLVNILTKSQYATEVLDRLSDDVSDPSILLQEDAKIAEPYVINSPIVTDEILEELFADRRIVRPDMAASLMRLSASDESN